MASCPSRFGGATWRGLLGPRRSTTDDPPHVPVGLPLCCLLMRGGAQYMCGFAHSGRTAPSENGLSCRCAGGSTPGIRVDLCYHDNSVLSARSPSAMTHLSQFLLVAIWMVGAVVWGLPSESSTSPPETESYQWLIDTDRVRLGLDRSRVVLMIETSGPSDWRVSASVPAQLAPDRTGEPSAAHGSEAAPVLPSIIRLVGSLL